MKEEIEYLRKKTEEELLKITGLSYSVKFVCMEATPYGSFIEAVVQETCKELSMTVSEFNDMLKCRKEEFVIARHIASGIIYNWKTVRKIPLRLICERFGGKNHATILNGLDAYQNMLDTGEFRQQIDRICERVRERSKSIPGVVYFKTA